MTLDLLLFYDDGWNLRKAAAIKRNIEVFWKQEALSLQMPPVEENKSLKAVTLRLMS